MIWGDAQRSIGYVVITILVPVVLLAVPPGQAPARANEALQESEALIRHGIQLRQVGNDDAAAPEFQKAYDLAPTPRAAAQLGLVEQALGRWEDAEAHLTESLQAGSDPWVAKNQATLLGALGRVKEHVGRIEVLGDPVGAEVYIGSKLVGKLPLPGPVHVRTGESVIELRAPGYVSRARPLTTAAGQYQSVLIRLEKVAASARAKAASEDPRADATVVVPAAVAVGAPRENEDATVSGPRTGFRNAAIATGVVGLAATGAGIYFGLQARSLEKQVTTAKTFDPAADSQGRSARTTQFVMYGLGGACLATAVILQLQYLKTESPTEVSLLMTVDPLLGGASVVGRF